MQVYNRVEFSFNLFTKGKVELVVNLYKKGGFKAGKGRFNSPLVLSTNEFILCQWDVAVKHTMNGIEVTDSLGRFFVEVGKFTYKGGRLRLHQEVQIKYL